MRGPAPRPRHLVLVCLVALVILGLGGCAKRRLPPPPPGTTRPYTIRGHTYHPLATARGYSEVGLASWYGPDFHGRRTASGEVYDMDRMTAAHKTLPIHTWVEVVNLDNGRRARVRINDRGPFVRGRIIDLSRAAAKRLGVIGPGTARVRVTALGYRKVGPAGKVSYTRPASYTRGVFTVQVGAFAEPANARRLARRLRPRWGKVTVVRFDRGDRVFHRVRVGRLSTLEQAKRLQERLRRAGFSQAFAVAW